jgi:hypothetical protein
MIGRGKRNVRVLLDVIEMNGDDLRRAATILCGHITASTRIFRGTRERMHRSLAAAGMDENLKPCGQHKIQ